MLPSNSTSGSETVSTSKKLITVHCRCPCGRRKQFPVIEEGKPVSYAMDYERIVFRLILQLMFSSLPRTKRFEIEIKRLVSGGPRVQEATMHGCSIVLYFLVRI